MNLKETKNSQQSKRIVFIDLLFSWPPKGGASVDIYHVLTEAIQEGYSPTLVSVYLDEQLGIGQVLHQMPFPIVLVPLSKHERDPEVIAKCIRERVDKIAPDVIFIAESWALTAYILKDLSSDYRCYSRFYAYEPICLLNGARYKNSQPCPNYYPKSGDICAACLCERPSYVQNRTTQEQSLVDITGSAYRKLRAEAFCQAAGIIVYNPGTASLIREYNPNILIIPGGVNTTMFRPKKVRDPGSAPKIIMTGRADDPAKGFSVLNRAVEALFWSNHRVQVEVTGSIKSSYIKSLNWVPFEKIPSLYSEADISVVPSIWEEPFGLTALEAMASSLPVVASRTGGLTTIVEDEKSGFLVPPGDYKALADRLKMLLDDQELRLKMGAEARRRAVEVFEWAKVFKNYYVPLIEAENSFCNDPISLTVENG